MTGLLAPVVSGVRALVRRWESIQVELHGSYSVERFVSMQNYRESTRVWCSLIALLAIPLFPLVCVAVVDAFPLASPDLGLAQSGTLWIRGMLVGFLDSYALGWMLSRYTPELKLSQVELLLTATAAAAVLHLTALGLMLLLWYPLPFAVFWTFAPWLGTLVLSLKVARGDFLRKHNEVQAEVRRFLIISIINMSTVAVYTAFNIILQIVPTEWQMLAAFTIPVFRILQKNLFCRLLHGKDDTKPETVALDVDVANALLISVTIQNLQSVKTCAMLIVLDFMQMLISLFDLRLMLKDIRAITNEEPDQAIARAFMIASKYPELAKQPKVPLPSKREIFRVSTSSRIRDSTDAVVTFTSRAQVPPAPLGNRIEVMSNCSFGVTVEKRNFLLQKVLRIMFFMECFLLSELMKALTPLMYSCYLVILYYWPNRRFYSQLEGLDEAGFWAVITHIQIYGILQVVLFVVLIGTLHQMAYKSPLQQLAYAVNRNWGKIQCKLMIWLLLLVQSAIPQLGTDFTFKFEWIQKR